MPIEDNEHRFDPNKTSDCICTKSMTSRIEFLNGTIEFETASGCGTTLNILIPL
jgi:signal transduction histidine kinase